MGEVETIGGETGGGEKSGAESPTQKKIEEHGINIQSSRPLCVTQTDRKTKSGLKKEENTRGGGSGVHADWKREGGGPFNEIGTSNKDSEGRGRRQHKIAGGKGKLEGNL